MRVCKAKQRAGGECARSNVSYLASPLEKLLELREHGELGLHPELQTTQLICQLATNVCTHKNDQLPSPKTLPIGTLVPHTIRTLMNMITGLHVAATPTILNHLLAGYGRSDYL